MIRTLSLALFASVLAGQAFAGSVSLGDRQYKVVSTSIIMLGTPAPEEPAAVAAVQPKRAPEPMIIRGGEDGSNVAVKTEPKADEKTAEAKPEGEKPAETADAKKPEGEAAADPEKTAAVDAPASKSDKKVAQEQ